MHNFKNTLSKNLTMRQIDRWIDGWIDRQTDQPTDLQRVMLDEKSHS